MRRGLMAWSEEELPVAALRDRAGRLQSAMQAGGLDALILYTSLVRPSAVHYLNGLTPYWSEGLLLLGRGGEPVFATALSKRVGKWMRSVSPVGEIVNTPRPGTLIGQRIAADKSARRVGILELDALPAGAYDDLAAAIPAVELTDATALFAQARRHVDAAERRLLARADAIATAALAEVDATAADAGAVAALVEKRARLDGVEEAYIMVAPDVSADRRMVRASPALPLGSAFAVRASIAYKGVWVRRTRTFVKDAAAQRRIADMDTWFAEALRALTPGKLAEQIVAGGKQLSDAEVANWMAESCRGTYPLQTIASASGPTGATLFDGDYVVLSLDLTVGGTPWLGAGPMVVGW
jgi:Xaa-Pro aminopeptidase